LVVNSLAVLAPDVVEKCAVRIGLFSRVFFALPALLLQFVPLVAVWVTGAVADAEHDTEGGGAEGWQVLCLGEIDCNRGLFVGLGHHITFA
jgi:hypothetical protein